MVSGLYGEGFQRVQEIAFFLCDPSRLWLGGAFVQGFALASSKPWRCSILKREPPHWDVDNFSRHFFPPKFCITFVIYYQFLFAFFKDVQKQDWVSRRFTKSIKNALMPPILHRDELSVSRIKIFIQ